ncbi:GNAT family N-acetyltransferase [Hydrogenophaga taeniospiralis]|uniref:GNAT family N-acetyltransferase n=1 Tax=Hydrogenophaga taeniospiralis TaxID=65656 RepID=UPI001CFBA0C2|nr:GNAT family N-acetyltransferase [Hydrogenophaga taeniospiralis]
MALIDMTPTILSDADIEAIERATLDAVSPERVEALPGWLLPMDSGTVGRARSAVPLSHVKADPAVLDDILDRYAAQGFVPSFRLPDGPAFESLHQGLQARGFARAQPTLTQCGRVQDLLTAQTGPVADLADTPDAAWMAMFLGEGLDPVDGASRARSLSRATGTLFVSLRDDGQAVACGAAAYGHGWLSVHGMRTAASHRGRGLAGRVLQAMAEEALRRGIHRVFLQVVADNGPALALYRRLGLNTAWTYAYWRR